MIDETVKIGENVKIPYENLVNLYGCELGDGVFIGPFVEIQKNSKIGAKTRIETHSFICEGVTIGENCLISHGVIFINDKFTEKREDWILRKTNIGNSVRIGSNSTILPVTVGDNSIIGAGTVVTKNVPENSVVIGNPAKIIKKNIQNSQNENLDEEVKVPFLDLRKHHDSFREEIEKAIKEVIDNSSFILGPKVEEFERNFSDFCNTKYCISVNSGTSALHLALLSCGIGKEDEVITVPNTFIATAEAISHCGAKPVFVDIKEEDYTINPQLIENSITEKTKAIIPVHLFGTPCDMDKINEIAKKHNLFVIEDACQAHGAEYNEEKTGSLSDVAAFSFYPGKNLGALGEGGAIVTNNSEIAEKCKILRAHGESPKNTHSVIGFNYRMHGIQAAILNIKLKYLEKWNELRKQKAQIYNGLLKEKVIVPKIFENHIQVFHLYVIRHKNRDELREFLKSKNIDTGIHYPIPIHLQNAYSHLGYKEGDFPVTEKVTKEIISLPIFPELTESQINHVAETIKEFSN